MKVTDHPAYNSFIAMHRRCADENSAKYHQYGGRGIKVSSRWPRKGGFLQFLEDMGDKPTPKHTIDRIDNDLGYNPENCRWADKRVQAINRRNRSPSGVKGVRWDKSRSKWMVSVRHNGKKLFLGRFNLLDDAIEVRKAAELKYYAPLMEAF